MRELNWGGVDGEEHEGAEEAEEEGEEEDEEEGGDDWEKQEEWGWEEEGIVEGMSDRWEEVKLFLSLLILFLCNSVDWCLPPE